jgi:HAD superfamily hydrolase (TIGR01509 family)
VTGPPGSPRAVLFDLDGTLADSLTVLRDAYSRFLGQFHACGTDDEFASLKGPPLAEIVRRLMATHGLPGDVDELLISYLAIIEKTYGAVAPSSGAQKTLEKARQLGCAVGIVTSNSAKRTQSWLESVGFSHLIDFIVSGEDVVCGKPHPEPYFLASKRAACPSSCIIAVEDSVQGAQSALGAGLRTYLLTDSDDLPAALEGVVPIRHLSEIFT